MPAALHTSGIGAGEPWGEPQEFHGSCPLVLADPAAIHPSTARFTNSLRRASPGPAIGLGWATI